MACLKERGEKKRKKIESSTVLLSVTQPSSVSILLISSKSVTTFECLFPQRLARNLITY